MKEINFQKGGGLVPAIVQDAVTQKVLMLGYMNKEAYQLTLESNRVTFYSRSKQQIWVKGESSGHYLALKDIRMDCDQDTLLVSAIPMGPVCHTGEDTCWGTKNNSSYGFLSQLEQTITDRKNNPRDSSYISSLFRKGINKIAQKVGEEAVEVVIEAKDENDVLFAEEAADLLFHFMILLQAKGKQFDDIVTVLKDRDKVSQTTTKR